MRTDLWIREEMLLALNLYLKLPFGRAHARDKVLVAISGQTTRSRQTARSA